MKKAHSLLLLAAAVMLLGIACGDSDDPDRPLTTDERAYLDSVEEARGLFTANLERFGELFGQAWPPPSQMFNALEEAGAGSAFDTALAALEKLEPPERFEADHELLVLSMRGIVALDKDVGQSVVDQDLTGFVVTNVELGQAFTRTVLALSTPVCAAANSSEEGAIDPLCQRLRPGQGEAYGEELYDLMSVLEIDFRTRVNFFAPSFEAEGRMEILAGFKPDIVRVLEETTETVGLLEPPAEFQEDHERLLSYLEEELEDARAIPEVPTNRPVAGGGPPQGRDSAPPYCTAKEDFSEEFLPLVVTYFGDRAMMCGPGPGGEPPSGGPPPGAR